MELQIASFIGSGINGNNKQMLENSLEQHLIASFIGSGINGNFVDFLEALADKPLIASFIGSGINGNEEISPNSSF